MIKEFSELDKPYLEWMVKNPSGFVLAVNTSKKSKEKLKFHRSNMCLHISVLGKNAIDKDRFFTGNKKMKVCSLNAKEIVEWALNNRREASTYSICKTCSPSEIKIAISNLALNWKEV